jgi:proteic killer suppression protein
VDITFSDKRLEELANNDRKRLREFGKLRSEKLRIRLAQLRDAENLEEVRYLPGNFHELTNNRKGQWACDLDQPYRLIFTPHEKIISASKHGQSVWMEITGVEVKEIVNYHKEK